MTNFELIENYLKGKLEGEALKAFETRLASDSEFATQVAEHKAVQEMIFMKGLLETKAKIQHIRKIKTENPGGKNSFWQGAILVFSLLILIGAGYLLFNTKKTTNAISTTDTLTAAYDSTNSSNEKEKITPENTLLKKNPNPSNEEKEFLSTKEETTSETPVIPITKAEPSKDSILIPEKKIQGHFPVERKTLCSDIHIKAKIQTEASCENASGTVSISQVSEGKAPYQFSFDNSEFSTSNFYNFIPAGEYSVVVKDANGCTATFNAKVGTKICGEKTNIFAPDRGETWKFPIAQGSNCKIQLYDIAGATIYEAAIINGYPSEWDGTGTKDAYTKAGAYLFHIHCSDGSQQQGTVTVIR